MNNDNENVKKNTAPPAEKGRAVAEALKRLYPDAVCSLEWKEPWHLLVMGRLSAQCTDARVNVVCRELFAKYPTLDALADCDLADLEAVIRPCGLYRTKAASVKAAAQMLRDEFGGVLPRDRESLLRLPGVGGKIANLLLGDVYGIPGIVPDTHCIRICGRLGFYPEELKDPPRVEKILSAAIPPEYQTDTCHRLVDFGRDVCRAQSPRCAECPEYIKILCEHVKGESDK